MPVVEKNMNPDEGLNDILKVVVKDLNLVNDNTPSVDIFDLDYLEARIKQVHEAFPEDFFTHALAMKSNSMRGVLKTVMAHDFMGAEGASIAEVVHAVTCGFKPSHVVYDSPVKSKVDLKKALDLGVIINLDNEFEMEVVDELLKNECKGLETPSIGLRLNPVVGGGTISIFNTATKLSKFGLPLVEETRERILDLFKKYEWLNGVHFHVGSQGNPLELFVSAAKIVMAFVKEIESTCQRKLKTIDIGGGLSTSYTDASEPKGFEFQTYRQQLQEAAPDLFSGRYRIVTEFGRSLMLKAGKTLTRIETIKKWLPEVQPIILTHVGSNQFPRETYVPQFYSHRMDVVSCETGTVKDEGKKVTYDIGGCLCFQGDYLKKDLELYEAKQGDILLIHETGAYTMAMYSKFNSILPSPVFGYRRKEDGGFSVVCIKERETFEETLAFWGSETPRIVQ